MFERNKARDMYDFIKSKLSQCYASCCKDANTKGTDKPQVKQNSKQDIDIKFRERTLHVKEAVEPDLIIWENYGITRKERASRACLFILFTLSILWICCFSVIRLEKRGYEVDKSVA